MADQSNQRVLINGGQALTSDDLTRISPLLQQQFIDEMIYPHACAAGAIHLGPYQTAYDGGVGVFRVWPIGSYSAYPFSAGGASREVTIASGTLAVNTGDYPDGGVTLDTDRLFRVARVAETTFALAANASGLDRWDVVSVVMAEADADSESRDFKDAVTGIVSTSAAFTRKRTTATLVLTQGTPGAGEPAPSSGVKLAAFLVPNGATAVSNTTGVRDYREPLRTKHLKTWGKDGWGTADWNRSDTAPWAQYNSGTATGTDAFTIPCPSSDGGDRLRCLALTYLGDLTPDSIVLGRVAADGTFTAIETLSLTSMTFDNTSRIRLWTPTNPVWGNGWPAGMPQAAVSSGASADRHSTLAIQVTCTDSAALLLELWSVDWYMGEC